MIGFYVYPGFQLLDLSGPLAAFEVAGVVAGGAPYQLRVLSGAGGPVRSSSGVAIATEAADGDLLDTLIVPGGGLCLTDGVEEIAVDIRKLAKRARRISSVCTGAFALARAGALEGYRVTTHWRHAATLRQRYPRIRVDAEPLFINDRAIWTATGTNAGIDMALAMIEEDFGTAISRATAQMMVVHQRRPGGQAQFAGLVELVPRTARVRKAIDYARTHLHEQLSIDDLAEIACLSPRQFTRVFTAEMSMPPAKMVEQLRAEAARLRIETTDDSVELIAHKVGFDDPERMRRAFIRVFGLPPQSIRRTTRAA